MSELYKKYKTLKEKDANTMYLFKSGNFYIFLGEDVDRINEYVVLKKTYFCKETMKCGFPVNSLEDYMKVFHNHGLPITVVESQEKKDINDLIDYLKKTDLDTLTPLKALNILYELKELIES